MRPLATRRGGSVLKSRRAYPIPVVPGSMPSTVLRLGVLEDLVGHVEVRVDLLDVVEVLELLHQTEDPAGLVAFDADGRRRAHRDLRRSDGDADLLER